ncbi:AAA family ATPase [Candidatus Acetothermia bacterium]|nr:AAA family ATPase [Candidatus Acetothermia bacterium]
MQLVIKLLGRFEVWPRQKTQELLKLLVSERGRSFSQDQLIEAFFPDLNPARAINNLQKRVSELRRALEPELTKGTDSQFVLQAGSREQGYYFSQEAACQLDTEEFQKHWEAAHAAEQAERWAQALEHYQRAVELYRGEFLLDSLYEEWTIAPRERWKEKYLSALMRLAEAHARLGHLSSAIECCEKVLEKEAWNENVIRQKMLYLYHMGNQPKALDTFKTCIEALKKHLGVEPTVETCQLHEQILKHQVPPLPRAIPNNLPQQLTSFIGREREIEEIKHLILAVGAQHAAPLQRLVTLTGVGGCGKTRLGLQIASQLLKEYADGAWWVELASLADPNLVVQAIASALGVKEQPGRPLLATVTDYLHSKQLLLILDNCEHLIEACAQVVQELLKACPKLQILVTSREPLGILGETVWQVPTLSVPDTPSLPSVGPELVSALQDYESVNLFVERAKANESKFRLSSENAQATAQVCYQLDGIPLAIELAAAWVRALSVEQIASRLGDRFHLLIGGNRAALPRHQTLRATMDWSYQLLSEKEQTLLRQLSIFAGGWTLEAAEAVCADELIQSQEVMELLTHLVDKSLVLVEKQGEVLRYKLLETVRQYGAEKLREAGETECVQSQHLDFFLKLAEQAEPELVGPKQKEWLDTIEQEHDNLRKAIAWGLENNTVEKSLRLVTALAQFWLVRGYWAEGYKVLSQDPERDIVLSK